jgi:hypothetical protein
MKPLTDKQLEIIPLLSQGLSYQQITNSTGIPKPTVARWAKLPQIQEEVNQLQKDRIEVCRETVVDNLEAYKIRMRQSRERQEQYLLSAQELGFRCSNLAQKLIEKAPAILEQDDALTPRLLATLIPGLIRASHESFKVGSEIEDKMLALEEMSHRLDQWESHWQTHQE